MTPARALHATLPALALACVGSVAVAQVPGRAADVVALVQANGCTITESEADALMPAAGLSWDDMIAAFALLNRGGLFTRDPDGRTSRLVPDLCAADAAGVAAALALAAGPAAARAADPVGALRGALEAVGCIMTGANQDRVLTESGLDAAAAVDALGVLIGAGEALAEGQTIRLLTGVCTGVGGDAPDPAMLAARRDRVAAALAARGCRINEREGSALAADLGLPDTELAATLIELIGRGEAEIDRSGALEIITLTAPPCDGTTAPTPPAITK